MSEMADAPRHAAQRLFVAVTLPRPLQPVLAQVQSQLRRQMPSGAVKWSPAEQLHLTLRFLGDVPADCVPAVAGAVVGAASSHRPFEVAVGDLGAFPDVRRPRVIWIGLNSPSRVLMDLQASVAAATAPWGKRDDKPFQGHLTLGRVREQPPSSLRQISRVLAAAEVGRLGAWRVESVELFRSELRPEGALHTRLTSAALGGAPAVG